MRLEAFILLVWAFAVGCGTEVGNGFNTGDEETQAHTEPGKKKSKTLPEGAVDEGGEQGSKNGAIDKDAASDDDGEFGSKPLKADEIDLDALMTACGSPFKSVERPILLYGNGVTLATVSKDGGVLLTIGPAKKGPYKFSEDKTIDLGADAREVPYTCEEEPKVTPQASGSIVYSVHVVPAKNAPEGVNADYHLIWEVLPGSEDEASSLVKLEIHAKSGMIILKPMP